MLITRDRLRSRRTLAGVIGLVILAVASCGNDGGGAPAAPAESFASPVTGTAAPNVTPTPTPTLALGPELVVNGSFEEGILESWELHLEANQKIEISEVAANTGLRSLRMFTALDVSNWPGLDLLDGFPVEAGARYRFGAVSQHSEFGPVQVLLRLVDAEGMVFTSFSNSSDMASQDGEWLDVSSVVTVPERAVNAYISVQLRIAPGAGEDPIEFLALFVDDVSVRKVLE